jgi:Protein of unknown function (DUF3313)
MCSLFHRLRVFGAFGFLLTLPCCSSGNRLLKARPAAPSAFFEQPRLAQDASQHLPFQKVWITPSTTILAAGQAKKKLYIAPVTLHFLRPVDKKLATLEISNGGLNRQEGDVARRLQEEFIMAFRRSPRPIYQLVSKPSEDALILQLAIIELNPTSPKGNAVMTLMKLAVSPVASLASYFTKGTMAIEGKVIEPRSRRAFFQFADKEADRLTFLSTRDFQPYGHAVYTMREWAVQFEQMTRTPPGQKMKDSSFMTLMPY